jgi:hypothetical protein
LSRGQPFALGSGVKQLQYFTCIVIILAAVSCANKEKLVCPTVEEEAVSVCRAKQNCMDVNTSTGIGIGVGFGLGSGSSVGVGVNRNRVDDDYPNCIDRELDAQKAAAELKKEKPIEKPK